MKLKRYLLDPLSRRLKKPRFPGSSIYWQNRYIQGGTSGPGSFGQLAKFKADILNSFVRKHQVGCVIEWGCGDGNQLLLSDYPKYIGFDVSPHAISVCRQLFSKDASKRFELVSDYTNEVAELSISLDVIFHLVEDSIFEQYMHRLFSSSTRFVIIYSSNTDSNKDNRASHVMHRKFTNWTDENISSAWTLTDHLPNQYSYNGDIESTSFSDFFVYERLPSGAK